MSEPGEPENFSYLDQEYGPAIEPQNGVKAWERVDAKIEPIHLNRTTAGWISVLLEAATASPIAAKAIESITILWVVDEAGDLYFAVEEVLDTKNGMKQRPRARGITLNEAVKPLGHPLLISLGKGRIGGEIYVDGDQFGEFVLVINNRSGRYGRDHSRMSRHLDNVAQLFGSFGVRMIPDFAL